MPLELGVWRIDEGVKPVEFGYLDLEERLEDILHENIEIASPNWLVIGRQVRTEHGGFIDLLAMDRDANLVVLELKKRQTPRDVVAQLLDYGSWVARLEANHVAQIFDEYQKRWKKSEIVSIDDAFRNKFKISMPDEINSSHELVIVAASLDSATERVVKYLAEEYGVHINAVFFRVFRDGDREYLSRAWFRDPAETIIGPPDDETGEWNGEYYVSFGYPFEVVRDGLKRGYVVAGGGSWYSRTLQLLEPNARVWVNVPGTGYVGVGIVSEKMVPVDDFKVHDKDGNEVPIIQVSEAAASLNREADDPEKTDYLVRVNWLKTVDPRQAIKEKGFFGNQNSVARPRTAKWNYTVERLKSRFGLDEKHIDDFQFEEIVDLRIPHNINKDNCVAKTRTLHSSAKDNNTQSIIAYSYDGKLILEYKFEDHNTERWVSYVIQGMEQVKKYCRKGYYISFVCSSEDAAGFFLETKHPLASFQVHVNKKPTLYLGKLIDMVEDVNGLSEICFVLKPIIRNELQGRVSISGFRLLKRLKCINCGRQYEKINNQECVCGIPIKTLS